MEFENVPEEHEIPETASMRRFDARMRELISRLKFPDQLPDDGDYRKPYLILFNGITDALYAMEQMNFGKARDYLMDAQRNAEDAFISGGDAEE